MIKFIDCNCMIGNRCNVREGSFSAPEDYLELMERCGIEQALVYHSMAKEYDAQVGNRMLDEILCKFKEFKGQWVVMPCHTDEFFKPERLIAEMKKKDIKSVRMFPAGSFSLKPYSCGPLFEELQSYKVPVFIGKDQIDWDELYELCTSYPDLPVVLCETNYGITRFLYPILYSCSNLYVDSSKFLPHNGIADFCKRFGSERMLFGSGMPQVSACGAVTLIRYADISEDEKQEIASQNLLRLLGEVRI